MTMRAGWDQHPGVRAGGPGRIAAFIVAGVVLVAAGVAVLPGWWAGLLGLAVLEASLVLMVRRAERIAIELALYNLDQARRAAAVAEELRAEMARLQTEVARIAAYSEKTRPRPN